MGLVKQGATASSGTEELRRILLLFLQSCGGSMVEATERRSEAHEIEHCCYNEASQRGYPMEGPNSFRSFISGGIPMAVKAYTHLKNTKVPILIALYTAFLIYLDDVLCHNMEAVSEFNERLATRRAQKDSMLDHFATLISEFPEHFPRITYNIMLASTMNFVTALLLEKETEGMLINSAAIRYPTLARGMSGASEVFALALFPSSVPVTVSIQALPELLIFINNGNDILSYYKEECDGEDVNKVTLISKCTGQSKIAVVQQLADEAVIAHKRIQMTLRDTALALEAYRSFSVGYLAFYSVLPRYRLDELGLVV